MEPIRSVAGEEAARKAAREYISSQDEDEEGMDNLDESEMTGGMKCWRFLESICVILFLPFLWLYDCFVFVIGARMFRICQTLFVATRRQAHLFLNGMNPYQCSAKITAVNLTVLCSFWYMFIDQARLAFMPVDADYTLAIINCVIWTILVIELIFEVFIRPDDFGALIVSDKAFTPTTVRYISFLHLAIEFISLIFFIPEFVCLFTDEECDGRPRFSFLNSSLLGIISTDRILVLASKAFFACIRLRVFGLVRHWKNMWIKRTFIKRFMHNKKYQFIKKPKMYKQVSPAEVTTHGDFDEDHPTPAKTRSLAVEAKAREAALINASNIGTALMVTNSYRALMILCAITGFFPMIPLIYLRGVTNPVTTDMIEQLQATNILATSETDESCNFFADSVHTWVDSWDGWNKRLITSDSTEFLVSLVIQPSRCMTELMVLTNYSHPYLVEEVACKSLRSKLDIDVSSGQCISVSILEATGMTLKQKAANLDLRSGSIQSASRGPIYLPMEYRNGTVVDSPFRVVANFNHTYSLETT